MRQCIFIHIPRTAGESIVRFAGTHSPSFQKYTRERWEPDGQFTTLRHRAAGWYLKKRLISQEWWDSSLKFTVVRNPWDRLVSLYEYLRGFRIKRRPRRVSNVFLESFDSFANEIASDSKLVAPVWSRNVKWFSQANPQVRWLKWGVDKILRFEHLNDEWEEFCRQVQFPIKPLPHHHKGKRKRDYRTYYTDGLAEIIGEYYTEDIEQFGYKF